ncbi:MAG: response regulator [Verrucomicrobia bacterium]|nr:response regulator [Verrucomicrobiota bacterium]
MSYICDICKTLAESGAVPPFQPAGNANIRQLTPEIHFVVPLAGEIGHSSQSKTSTPLYGAKKGSYCLLVDDVPMNLMVLEATMKRMGFKTIRANSGKEALKILETEPIDIVLTDLWMPEMSGVELTDHIRQTSSKKDIPVIAVTADTYCQERLKLDFFNDVIFKPISIHKLNEVFIVED